MRIILDFDSTLFSSKNFLNFFKKDLKKNGIPKKLFEETYEKAKNGGYYPEKQIDLILRKKPEIKKEKLKKIFQKNFKKAPKFLYSDTLTFLKKWNKKAEIFILSYGEDKFQRMKIHFCGVDKLVKKIFITRDVKKVIPFKLLVETQQKIVFVDDNPDALYEVKKRYPEVIVIRINRKQGKHYLKAGAPNIDFSISNLKELEGLLKKFYAKPRALMLFSGGIDSILAAKILMKQKINVQGIVFKSCFFNESQARKSAKKINLPLKIIDFSSEHLAMVKNPQYGYGSSMNPCIDCHLLMIKKTGEIMRKKNYDFVATGEVLGERPMSQNKNALDLIEKKSLLTGYLLRPLSARLLSPTVPEKLGLVDRKRLLNISGRRRNKQIELAKKYKIENYPHPAGGCLLTDLIFGKRLKELFNVYPSCKANDIELLKIGRHFWEGKTKIVVGRNEEENKKIKKIAKNNDIVIEMKKYPGPSTLVRNYGKKKVSYSVLKKGMELTKNYSAKARFKKDVKFNIKKI